MLEKLGVVWGPSSLLKLVYYAAIVVCTGLIFVLLLFISHSLVDVRYRLWSLGITLSDVVSALAIWTFTYDPCRKL